MSISGLKSALRRSIVTRRLYSSIWKLKQVPSRKRLQRYGPEIVKALYCALEGMEAEYFYDFGSLLGLMREGRFLAHDTDIDVGVLKPQSDGFLATLRSAMVSNGFKPHCHYVYKGETVECSFKYFGVTVDLFLYSVDSSTMTTYVMFVDPYVRYTCASERSVARLQYDAVTCLEYVSLYGIPMRVPKDWEHVLEQKYGKEWRIPDSQWDSSKSRSFVRLSDTGICVKDL